MLPPFRVYSHFDDGDVKEFSPPRTLLTLDVPSAGAFPKVGRAGLILAEIDDSEALTALAQKTFEKLTEQMEGTKQEMMGSGVNATAIDWREVWDVVGPIVYGYVKDLIAAGLADDVFPPKEVSVDIASDDFYWGDGTKLSPEATVEFRGHEGLYYLTYYWEIQTLASSHVGGGGVWQGGSP